MYNNALPDALPLLLGLRVSSSYDIMFFCQNVI